MRYRADIDGLRAIAVVPVVLFHANVPPFRGGFVGVDVFFVISGYLITSLIVSEIDRGDFSIVRFYVRRMRRIFPALFVVLAFAAACGWIWLTPFDYKLLGQSIFATAAFASNILFWRQSGYFDAPLSERPLLHTWSLAVEEQYYAVFPIYLVLIARFIPKGRMLITAMVCIASFALNIATVRTHPSAAFFLAPHRVWELLVGGLLALGVMPRKAPALWRDGAGACGIVLIAIAIFAYSQATRFPGAAALLPVAGTALVLWSGEGASCAISRGLSWRPFVFVGQISYSLYLWHFVLLSFAGYLNINGLDHFQTGVLLALSVVIAWLSWAFIEQPIRRGRWIFARPVAVLVSGTVAIAVFGAFGLAAHLSDGIPSRITAAEKTILDAEVDFDKDRNICPTGDVSAIAAHKFCKLGVAGREPSFILWGNSHAEAFRRAIGEAALRNGVSGVFAGWGGCVPLVGVGREDEPVCMQINDAILKFIVTSPSIGTVLLSGRWALWAEGTRYKREKRLPNPIVIVGRDPSESNGNQAVFALALDRTVARLTAAGKDVWLVGPVPEVGYPVPRALYLARRNGLFDVQIQPTFTEFETREKFVLSQFEMMGRKYTIHPIWPHLMLCTPTECRIKSQGMPLYVDDNHLTLSAARSISSIFDPIFVNRKN